jgi:hypothetical protein
MAQSAVAAISKGCQMLSEGKAEIDKFKKQVEGGVANAQAIYKEVTGLWGWVQGLFGKPPARRVEAKPVVSPTPTAKPTKAKKQPEPELSYEEFQARQVHEICENLKVYFEALRQLKQHCRELEEASLTTDNVAGSAIDRIEIEWQMQELSKQVSHVMIYGTPEKLGLGDLYKKFLRMYDQILEEQEFDRMAKRKKEIDAAWQRDLLRRHRIDRGITAVTVVLAILWMWGTLLSLGWLVKTPGGLLRVLLF